MKEFKVAPVHPLLNGITPLVTVTTEILVAVALLTGARVLFGIDLMLGLPVGLVVLWFGELTTHMAEVAIVSRRQNRIRAVVTQMTPQPIDLLSISKRFRVGMTGLAGDRRRLKDGGVHLVIVDIKGVKLFLLFGICQGGKGNLPYQQEQKSYQHHFFHVRHR
jgi:hypothetical protein